MVGCQGIGIGAFGVFLPTFINEFGFDPLETQLYSMIPYAFGLAGLLAGSWLADHLGRKAGMILVCLATTITGFIILLSTTNKVALLAGACFVTTGAYPGLAIGVAWHLSCHGGYTKRAMCIWICQIFVQSYSIISTQTYRDPPRFFLGHGVSVGLYCVGAVCTVVLHQICKTANAAKTRRAQEFEADGVDDPLTSKDLEELCDYHPKYMYAL
jgi:MFS family permease